MDEIESHLEKYILKFMNVKNLKKSITIEAIKCVVSFLKGIRHR